MRGRNLHLLWRKPRIRTWIDAGRVGLYGNRKGIDLRTLAAILSPRDANEPDSLSDQPSSGYCSHQMSSPQNLTNRLFLLQIVPLFRGPRGTRIGHSPRQGPPTIHALPENLIFESQSVVDTNLANVGSYPYKLPEARPRCANLFSGLLDVSLNDWMKVGFDNIAEESGLNSLLANTDARWSRIASNEKRSGSMGMPL